jgi:hypothetical protein
MDRKKPQWCAREFLFKLPKLSLKIIKKKSKNNWKIKNTEGVAELPPQPVETVQSPFFSIIIF